MATENIQAYFTQLNPIAERIGKAINDTKSAYGALWYTLNSNDQNEIINETLIKPEITLQYIDNLCAKRSLSTSSLQYSPLTSMTEDLTDSKVHKYNIYGIRDKQYYGYDGRSLSSYANQRVAQKLLKDDTLADAGYRDEHSGPFSYRTRSQINFHLFNNNDDTPLTSEIKIKDKDLVMPFNRNKVMTVGVRKQQDIIKKPKQAPPPIPVAKVVNVISKNEEKLSKSTVTNMPDYLNYPMLQNDDENSSLIPITEQLRKNSKTLLSVSQLSNTTVSDEDEYYHDGRQNQLEEVKLLETNVNFKRGFEFLSNW